MAIMKINFQIELKEVSHNFPPSYCNSEPKISVKTLPKGLMVDSWTIKPRNTLTLFALAHKTFWCAHPRLMVLHIFLLKEKRKKKKEKKKEDLHMRTQHIILMGF